MNFCKKEGFQGGGLLSFWLVLWCNFYGVMLEGIFLWIINNMYFQYYSLVIFLVCLVVMIAVGLLTKAPSYDKLAGLTYATISDEQRIESRTSWDWRDVAMSCVVLVAILAAYLYFAG